MLYFMISQSFADPSNMEISIVDRALQKKSCESVLNVVEGFLKKYPSSEISLEYYYKVVDCLGNPEKIGAVVPTYLQAGGNSDIIQRLKIDKYLKFGTLRLNLDRTSIKENVTLSVKLKGEQDIEVPLKTEDTITIDYIPTGTYELQVSTSNVLYYAEAKTLNIGSKEQQVDVSILKRPSKEIFIPKFHEDLEFSLKSDDSKTDLSPDTSLEVPLGEYVVQVNMYNEELEYKVDILDETNILPLAWAINLYIDEEIYRSNLIAPTTSEFRRVYQYYSPEFMEDFNFDVQYTGELGTVENIQTSLNDIPYVTHIRKKEDGQAKITGLSKKQKNNTLLSIGGGGVSGFAYWKALDYAKEARGITDITKKSEYLDLDRKAKSYQNVSISSSVACLIGTYLAYTYKSQLKELGVTTDDKKGTPSKTLILTNEK